MNLDDIQIKTPEQIALQFQLAGLGSRATAFLMDAVILFVTQFILGLAASYFMDVFNMTSGYVIAGLLIIEFLMLWGYFALFEFFSAGQTLGKMLVRIRVIQDNGQNLTFLSAFIRNLILIADFLPALFLIGIILIFFHPKHKRLGDLAAGTIVVHDRKKRSDRKKRALKKELDLRGIDPGHVSLEEWSKKKITSKEWDLLKMFVERRHALPEYDREKRTQQVAQLIFPALNLSTEGKVVEQLEAELLAIYVQLQEDWDYDF